MLSRRGATLVELLVAMTLTAVVLGAATSAFVRQRRGADLHASRASAESQLRAALGELQMALDGLSAAAGDLVAGEARDTALQLRMVVASAIACDSGAGHALLASDDTSAVRAAGFAAAPKIGDTLWWHVSGPSSWMARPVTGITASVGACVSTGGGAQPILRLALPSPDTVPRGAPVRLTRQARFSFYHAGDGSWQLGVSEWSDVLHAFAPPQPIAGPFTLALPGGVRTGFRYFDGGGAELPVGPAGVSVASVARVRISAIAPEDRPAGAAPAYRRDSIDVAVAHAP